MKTPGETLSRLLSNFAETDLGNAERFVKRNDRNLMFCPGIGWHFWDGSRWCRDIGDVQVKLAAQDAARSIQDEATVLEKESKAVEMGEFTGFEKDRLLKKARALREWGRKSEAAHRISAMAKLGAPHLAVAPDRLDSDPLLINVRNGTLHVRPRDGEDESIVLRTHDRRDLITKICPVDYDPMAVCPTYDAFIADAQPAEVSRFLHEWMGLSLTGDAREERFVYFWGKGANGRTLLLRLWAYLAGDYAKLVPIETFCDGQQRRAGAATPDLSMLAGARLVYSQSGEDGRLSENLIKLMTGGDRMPVRDLHKGYFGLRRTFKITLSSNYKPLVQGGDPTQGIWRRMIIVPWTQPVLRNQHGETVFERMKSEDSGVLNHLLNGLCEYLDRGLMLPRDVVAATEQHRRDSDRLGRFLSDATVPDINGRVQADLLYQVSIAWCQAMGEPQWTANAFGRAVGERLVRKKSYNNWWLGIKLIRTVDDFANLSRGFQTKLLAPDA
jgi:putative DNA primase/helicase